MRKYSIEIVFIVSCDTKFFKRITIGNKCTVEFRVADEVCTFKSLQVFESAHDFDYICAIQIIRSFQAPELVWMFLNDMLKFLADVSVAKNPVHIETAENVEHSLILIKRKYRICQLVLFEHVYQVV